MVEFHVSVKHIIRPRDWCWNVLSAFLSMSEVREQCLHAFPCVPHTTFHTEWLSSVYGGTYAGMFLTDTKFILGGCNSGKKYGSFPDQGLRLGFCFLWRLPYCFPFLPCSLQPNTHEECFLLKNGCSWRVRPVSDQMYTVSVCITNQIMPWPVFLSELQPKYPRVAGLIFSVSLTLMMFLPPSLPSPLSLSFFHSSLPPTLAKNQWKKTSLGED